MSYKFNYDVLMNTAFNVPKHKLIGHRGVAGLRPENTYCSFVYAADLGLDWIEFDVLLTLDEKWVVIHDDTVDRTTNGQGMVRDMTLQDLEKLEAGLWFLPPYAGQKIPTLTGTLELAQQRGLFCNIEIKGADHAPDRYALLMSQFLSQYSATILSKIMLSSFNLPCLIKIRELMPAVQIGYLVDEFAPNTITIAQLYNFSCINCDVKKMTPENLDAAKLAKLPVFLYTVNEPITAKFWLSKGINGLFTDRPDLLLI
jgi:glycerophosphoryl diester phosphodiesterase